MGEFGIACAVPNLSFCLNFPMKIIESSLPGVVVIEPKVFGDMRGFFMESWNQGACETHGIPSRFVQDNHSRSARGVLRGLHFQIKDPQGKLVRVTRGEVFDVAVDIRKSSPHFGQWFGVTLSEENFKQIWVPPGFAHGFYVVSESADFQYKCTEYYSPEHERSLQWDDPAIGIDWPIPEGEIPTLSDKDRICPPFQELELFE